MWSKYLEREDSKIVGKCTASPQCVIMVCSWVDNGSCCPPDLFVGQLKSSLTCSHCGFCSTVFDPFWDLSLPIAKVSERT